MVVPTQRDFHRPVLDFLLLTDRVLSVNEIFDHTCVHFGLTDDDLKERTPSGASRVRNRVLWAISYLRSAGLLSNESPGRLKITNAGKTFAAQHEGEITGSLLKQLASKRLPEEPSEPSEPDLDFTPDEQMELGFHAIRTNLVAELVETIQAMSPDSFERLCLDLLEGMGYGKGEVVGKSGDGGIDVIVNQDTLGLEKVYVQAKRWSTSNVGAPDIQKFSGSLNMQKANKGVFITSAQFTPDARESALKASNQNIILIGGGDLAKLMIEHNVGVISSKTYTIKKLDANYFSDDA